MKKLLLLLCVPMLFSCGDLGCISGGCENGQGTYTYSYGDKYVGEWKDDTQCGQGVATFADGDKYVGEFKDGTMNGKGIYTYADGKIEEGLFKDAEFIGE